MKRKFNGGYKGSKPCPGCQRDTWRRSVDSVCDDCQQNIEAGKIARAALAKGETRAMVLEKPVYTGQWSMPDGFEFDRQSYAHKTARPPYLRGKKEDLSEYEFINQVNRFLEALAVHPDTPTAPEFTRVYYQDSWGGLKDRVKLKAEHGLAWLRFYDYVCRYMQAIQDEAKAEGENLLFRLVQQEVGFQPLIRKEQPHDE